MELTKKKEKNQDFELILKHQIWNGFAAILYFIYISIRLWLTEQKSYKNIYQIIAKVQNIFRLIGQEEYYFGGVLLSSSIFSTHIYPSTKKTLFEYRRKKKYKFIDLK